MATTRLGQVGVGVQPYPGFAPKAEISPRDGAQFTRLGQSAVGVQRYGVFQPKAPAIVVDQAPARPAYDGPDRRRRYRRYKTGREELEEILADIVAEIEPKPAKAKRKAQPLAERAVGRVALEELAALKAAADRRLAEQAKIDRDELLALFAVRRAIRLREDEEAAVLLLLSTIH